MKFSHKLPFALESKLIHRCGYHIQGRVWQDSIIFVKDKPTKQSELRLVVNTKLPKSVQDNLDKRCDTIVGFFHDPYSMIMPVRQRLHNFIQGLPTFEERQYVLEYMDENFPLEGNN